MPSSRGSFWVRSFVAGCGDDGPSERPVASGPLEVGFGCSTLV
ncbi:MAG: hypothetical protein ACODAG_01890 [Myxococcota bacterium]